MTITRTSRRLIREAPFARELYSIIADGELRRATPSEIAQELSIFTALVLSGDYSASTTEVHTFMDRHVVEINRVILAALESQDCPKCHTKFSEHLTKERRGNPKKLLRDMIGQKPYC